MYLFFCRWARSGRGAAGWGRGLNSRRQGEKSAAGVLWTENFRGSPTCRPARPASKTKSGLREGFKVRRAAKSSVELLCLVMSGGCTAVARTACQSLSAGEKKSGGIDGSGYGDAGIFVFGSPELYGDIRALVLSIRVGRRRQCASRSYDSESSYCLARISWIARVRCVKFGLNSAELVAR